MNYGLHRWRLAVVFLADISMVAIAWISAFILKNQFPPLLAFSALPLLMLIQGFSFYSCGLYRGIWRFASIPDLIRILKAVFIGIIGLLLMALITPFQFDTAILIVYGLLLIVFLSAPRGFFRWLKDYRKIFVSVERVLIIGAGNAGESIVRDLRRFPKRMFEPIGFLDDHPTKLGQEIHGLRVLGTCGELNKWVAKLNIQLVLIAMPSANSKEMRRIVNFCEEAKVPFRTLPGIKELTEGKVSIDALRHVSLEDLLGREQIDFTSETKNLHLKNQVVLVTGGGGSIGSELCHQIACQAPKTLIILENCEYNLYTIELKLRETFKDLTLVILLGSITDQPLLLKLFNDYKPQYVFHAAAYKHVPLLETQIRVAMANNILGTLYLAEMAIHFSSHAFILISTDKAVNPTSIMGATKRGAEKVCLITAQQNTTRFITVRFGNVLNSTGSIVPLFQKQLENNGPLTVTDKEITRYFMTIPEASQLIIEASSIGKGGDIFVLDMGEPIKIAYLAQQLIRLSGKLDVEIIYTGLRKGEKLHEELFYEHECLNETSHPKIQKATTKKIQYEECEEILTILRKDFYHLTEEKLLALLLQLVPEYFATQLLTQHSIKEIA